MEDTNSQAYAEEQGKKCVTTVSEALKNCLRSSDSTSLVFGSAFLVTAYTLF